MTTKYIRWGILGAGKIAKAFAMALPKSKTGRLAAIGSRDGAKAATFAAEFGKEVRAHGSYESLLADPEVDAIYIANPHPEHARWAIATARAGKHILCEKPLAMNRAEASAVVEEAREHGIFLMEAFMYRCHPLTARWQEVVRSGALGKVATIQAVFSFRGNFDPQERLFKNELGGGGILDVGCYTTSISRLAAGAALGKEGAVEPIRITGVAHLHPETGVDLWASATALFPEGIVAEWATGVGLNRNNGLWIFGTEGSLHVPSPYIIAREGGKGSFFLTRQGRTTEEIVVESNEWLYGLEADAVGTALANGLKESHLIPVADTLGNMAALDSWRASAGLVYKREAVSFPFPTVHGGPLRRRKESPMTYGTIPGIEFPVSRLVIGCDNQQTMPHAAILFDDFFERGGNVFDTAHVYSGGLQERLLGKWIARRGLRKKIAVIVKGAHTPLCTPEHLTEQLHESLNRLGTDYADMYLMHRDNPDIPVGEFVDVLNQHLRKGLIHSFGGSNWTLERLKQADSYAKKKKLRGFDLVSNNFSLARMVDPVWEGCISASQPEFKTWLKKSDKTLLAWSSQARGFFTERAGVNKKEDTELVRCWYSKDNFKRRERAFALAKEMGVSPIHIALAYVLHQPFAPFALIGPRQISETADTIQGLRVTLSQEELSWLNLEK